MTRAGVWVASERVGCAPAGVAPSIAGDWQMYSPLRYVLDVERPRPDVAVLETGFLQSDWYHTEVNRRYPQLTRGCETEQRAVLDVLRRLNDDPSLWRDISARGELNDRLDDLLIAVIAHQLARGPVYMTIDTALAWDERDKKFLERLKKDHDIVPRGVVMELVSGHAIRDVRRTPILTRGLIDGTVRYDDDEVVPNELVPTYRAAFLSRARYLAVTRHFQDAIADYQQALAFDPENRMLEQELLAVQAAMR